MSHIHSCRRIQQQPLACLLLLFYAADKVIGVEDGRKFAAVLPGNRLVEVEGADHNFTGSQEHLQQLIQAVVEFLQSEQSALADSRSPQQDGDSR